MDPARWLGGGVPSSRMAIGGWTPGSGARVQFVRHLVYRRWVYGVEGIQIAPLRLSVGIYDQVSTTR